LLKDISEGEASSPGLKHNHSISSHDFND